jgi:hypothetical protein
VEGGMRGKIIQWIDKRNMKEFPVHEKEERR